MDVFVAEELKCFHCSQPCNEILYFNELPFCCAGCKSVFEILNENNLCDYYGMNKNAGVSPANFHEGAFDYLDDLQVRKKIVSFDGDDLTKVTFHIPAIHCASCIWLLENLQKLVPGIFHAEVHFSRKSVTIDFNPSLVKLSRLAGILASLGYAPSINLGSVEEKKTTDHKTLLYRLVIAGFCFGNVMLFSFPEYLGLDQNDAYLMQTFSSLNLLLSVPVFFYSAWDYFRSASKSFVQKQINIDVPIAVGLLALFFRSAYDIITGTGPGYLDSFTGLVFFLLIGRWFQSKTYESLSFDRDFKSYFPLTVNRLVQKEWRPTIIYELEKGDHIKIRNMEIVPADSLLLNDNALFDYSFVTGESKPVAVKKGDTVYAGGKLMGQPVTMAVLNNTSQSHLTSLWNNSTFKKTKESQYQKIIDNAARRFTWVVLVIALVTSFVWHSYKPEQMWLVITSVLMVACPCALALAAPFTYGSMLRVFGRYHFYLKNADIIERLSKIDSVVFDKTGTIIYSDSNEIEFTGTLTNEELTAVKLLTGSSTHPLSRMISKSISAKDTATLTSFEEIPGNGIQGMIEGKKIRIGSAEFVGVYLEADTYSSLVFVVIDEVLKGYFTIRIKPRENIKSMLDRLGDKCVALISGDNEGDKGKMAALFSPSVQLLFNHDPHDKLAFIKELQNWGKKVLMVGDGLNDSGALKQSDVGIAVTDDTGVFVPACDGILSGNRLIYLDRFLELAKSATIILKAAFFISFLYNAIALSIAVTGHLTPLVAAILMPISSISVVSFSTWTVNYVAKKKLKDLTP